MNEVIKAMKERRSIRKFQAAMPPKELIDQILDAGLYAANGKGQQAVITLAITDPKLRNQISADNCKIGGWQEGFLGNKNWPTSIYDGSLVMGNLMLAAHSLGLGSIWIHRAKEEFQMDAYKQLLADLGVEGEWEGIGHCAIGYIDGEVPQAAKRKEDRVFYVE